MAEKWIDENGKNVFITPFFNKIFTDEESMELDKKYNLYLPPTSISALGKTEYETAADSLNQVYHLLHQTVGIDAEELDKIGDELSTRCLFGRSWDYSALAGSGILRKKKVRGIEVLFPTEDLIKRAFEERKQR